MRLMSRSSNRDERGAVLVFVAPLFLALFAITALVVDLGNARQESRHTQASADAAALAGARELPLAAESTAAAERAVDQAAKNVNINLTGSDVIPGPVTCTGGVPANSSCYLIGDAKVVIASPYEDAPATAPAPYNLAFVQICQPTSTFFGSVIGATSPTVCREAVGRRVSNSGGYPMGLVVTEPSACKSLEFSGTSGTVLSSNGAVMVNSSCTTNALEATGSAWRLEADYIGVVGKAALAPCEPPSTCTATQPTENIDHFDDPYGHIRPPSPLPANSTTSSDTCAPSSGTRVMLPGRYPNRCTFEGNDGFVFRPGVYYFENGFSARGTTPLICDGYANSLPLPVTEEGVPRPPDCTGVDEDGNPIDGVTFIIANRHVSMNGNSDVYLPGPTSGPYTGIAIYQLSTDESTINGTADFLLGSVYAPNAHYNFTGNGGGSRGINIEGMVVTKTAEISGSFRFDINVPDHAPEAKIEDDFGLWK